MKFGSREENFWKIISGSQEVREAFGKGWGQFSFPWYFLSEKGGRSNSSLVIWENPLYLIKYPLHLVPACPVFREASGGTWGREVPDLSLSTSPRSCGSHPGSLPGNAKQRKAESTGKSVRRHHFKSMKGSCYFKSFDNWGIQTRQSNNLFCFPSLCSVVILGIGPQLFTQQGIKFED